MKIHMKHMNTHAGRLLAHLHSTGVTSLTAAEAGAAMQCEPQNVPGTCGRLVCKGFLRMEWERDGVRYTLPDGLVISRNAPYMVLVLPNEDPDQDEEVLPVRRTLVCAAGRKPPLTMAVRSVFELGQVRHD